MPMLHDICGPSGSAARRVAEIDGGKPAPRAGSALLAGVGLTAISVVSLPATAQVPTEKDTGSMIPIPMRARIPEGSDGNVDAARVTASNFARCVVARNPKGVARAIELPVGQPASIRAMTALATSECLDSGSMTIPQRVMRGAIFVELYRIRVTRKVDIAASHPIDLDNELSAEYRDNPLRYNLLAFGACVVKRDEQNARDVVLLPTAGKAQTAAFRVLVPNLGACLTQGQQVTFSKPIIEGVLAEVLYRGTVEPSTVAGNK